MEWRESESKSLFGRCLLTPGSSAVLLVLILWHWIVALATLQSRCLSSSVRREHDHLEFAWSSGVLVLKLNLSRKAKFATLG